MRQVHQHTTDTKWTKIQQTAQQIAERAHVSQLDKAGAPYIGHPERVVENVRLYEQFIWQQAPDRIVNMGGQQLCEVIDAAITAAWLHDVIEDSGAYGDQITAGDLRKAGIPAIVVEAVELVTDDKTVPAEISGLERKAKRTANKLSYYAAIKANEIARIVKLADLADNNNKGRSAVMRAAGGTMDPAKYPMALAALELSEAEWQWFNQMIDRRLN